MKTNEKNNITITENIKYPKLVVWTLLYMVVSMIFGLGMFTWFALFKYNLNVCLIMGLFGAAGMSIILIEKIMVITK